MDKILIVDFGHPNAIALAKIVREEGVYCEIVPPSKCMEAINEAHPKGLIFIGGNGKASVNEEGASLISKEVFDLGIPVLAFGYGMHVIAHVLGGEVKNGGALPKYQNVYARLYEELIGIKPKNYAKLFNADANDVFVGVIDIEDYVSQIPEGFDSLCVTFSHNRVAGMYDEKRNIYAFSFDPIKSFHLRIKELLHNVFFKPFKIEKSWNTRQVMSLLKEQIKCRI